MCGFIYSSYMLTINNISQRRGQHPHSMFLISCDRDELCQKVILAKADPSHSYNYVVNVWRTRNEVKRIDFHCFTFVLTVWHSKHIWYKWFTKLSKLLKYTLISNMFVNIILKKWSEAQRFHFLVHTFTPVGAQKGVPWNPLKKTTFSPEFCDEICTIYVRVIKNHNSAIFLKNVVPFQNGDQITYFYFASFRFWSKFEKPPSQRNFSMKFGSK